jgi:hypothetical protein
MIGRLRVPKESPGSNFRRESECVAMRQAAPSLAIVCAVSGRRAARRDYRPGCLAGYGSGAIYHSHYLLNGQLLQ